jgi:hypothetical protein
VAVAFPFLVTTIREKEGRSGFGRYRPFMRYKTGQIMSSRPAPLNDAQLELVTVAAVSVIFIASSSDTRPIGAIAKRLIVLSTGRGSLHEIESECYRRVSTPKVGFFKLPYLKKYTIHKLDL